MSIPEILRRNGILPESATKGEPSLESWFAGGGFVPPKLGQYAEEQGQLRLGPGGSLWRYEHGVYVDDGEEWLAGLVRDVLAEEFRRNRLAEVRAWCHANTAARLSITPPSKVINVSNGILHWQEETPRLDPHNPESASFIQVPVVWDPEARCPETFAFLKRVLAEDEIHFRAEFDFLMEWIGHLLVPANRFKKALLIVGPGDAGKSTLLRIIEELLGSQNVSHATLQNIADDRFGAADLFGRLANISADLDAKALKTAGTFKALTGDDTVRIERKFRDAFSARLFAKLMFSANEAPGTADQSDAYYGRWFILPMRRSIPVSEQRPELTERLTTPEELSGLLLHAVCHLKVLDRRKRFEEPESVREAGHEYRLRTDTVRGFIEERCEFDPEARTTETQLYEDYSHWCQKSGRYALAKARFREHLDDVYPEVDWHKKYSGYPTWFGIRPASA